MRTAIALTSILASGVCAQDVENPCVVCPSGVTFNGELCSDIISDATLFESGSDDCTSLEASLEALCCPPEAENPCELCPNGVTFDGMIEFEGVSTNACSNVISLATQFESGSVLCTDLEALCCPPEAENPCELCPDGLTVDGEYVIDGITMSCTDIASIVMGFESGSDECAEVLREELELMCCPSASGGVSFSGLGGFAFASVVSAAWAVGFV
jgi:hypothetical protein